MDVPRLYQDDAIVVVDKPAGIVVHAGHGTSQAPTVVDCLRREIDDPEQPERPGIVHRLDRDTSGVLVVARTSEFRRNLQQQFKQRSVTKYYYAAVKGHLRYPQARLEWPIARHPKNPLKRSVSGSGKLAVTEYEVISEHADASLLKIQLLTGRTHQIRVHMQHLGHPILGDELYGSSTPGLSRQFLHASELTLTHPTNGRMSFSSPLPDELETFWYNEARNDTP